MLALVLHPKFLRFVTKMVDLHLHSISLRWIDRLIDTYLILNAQLTAKVISG